MEAQNDSGDEAFTALLAKRRRFAHVLATLVLLILAAILVMGAPEARGIDQLRRSTSQLDTHR